MPDDDFEYWLTHMDDTLDSLVKRLGGIKLDYSVESLDAVEAWILENHADADETQASPLLDGLACYVGEVMRKQVGGVWRLENKRQDVFFGLPVLVFHDPSLGTECPHTLVTAAASRRTGRLIRGVVDSYREQSG